MRTGGLGFGSWCGLVHPRWCVFLHPMVWVGAPDGVGWCTRCVGAVSHRRAVRKVQVCSRRPLPARLSSCLGFTAHTTWTGITRCGHHAARTARALQERTAGRPPACATASLCYRPGSSRVARFVADPTPRPSTRSHVGAEPVRLLVRQGQHPHHLAAQCHGCGQEGGQAARGTQRGPVGGQRARVGAQVQQALGILGRRGPRGYSTDAQLGPWGHGEYGSVVHKLTGMQGAAPVGERKSLTPHLVCCPSTLTSLTTHAHLLPLHHPLDAAGLAVV